MTRNTPIRKSKKHARAKMTWREKRILEGLSQGKNQSAIAEDLGTTRQNVSNAVRALAQKARKAPEILAAIGLDLQTGLERYLKPLLEATETKFFAHEGRVVEAVEVEANDIRMRALDMFSKLHGAYPKNGNGESEPPAAHGLTINLIGITPERAQELLAKIDLLDAKKAGNV